MAIIKCKMCGGDLNLIEGDSVAECEYCGSRQTVPTADNEKKLTLFARANRLRFACEFDKAAGVYEAIVADFPEEAEAYWGLVLCKYGIEYVDDPATGKKIPTCHRSSFESVMEDSDFEQAQENADALARRLYREEAKAIEEIRKGIIEVSGKEEPYDIFICYKETDENGDRTLDSVLAQDIYDALTEKGYRVFFSRITLEDKLGQEYEPYIFAALNSAKIMLAVGTDYEYYNAVWVKNEWSRFLKLMASGQKKVLIPCYKNLDAYDMPKEFARLQAQDLGKVGAVQDLLRGIEKILSKGVQKAEDTPVAATPQPGTPGAASLLRRGQLFLEDGEWESADECYDKALDIDPENAEAYLGQLLAKRKAHNREELVNQGNAFEEETLYQKALRFADADFRTILVQLAEENRPIVERIAEENKRRLQSYRERIAPAEKRIVAESNHTIGLKADGTVVATGDNTYGECNVSGWTDIVEIFGGYDYTVGLKSDGRVVATGSNNYGNVSDWTDTVKIIRGTSMDMKTRTYYNYTIGLKSDGRVVATGGNKNGECNVSGWTDIVKIFSVGGHTVGLKSDGRVVATGKNEYGECNVSDWTDVVEIIIGGDYTAGLKSDGRVVATGRNEYGEWNVSDWTDIVKIIPGSSIAMKARTGYNYTIGLKSDGRVVAAGGNKYGECNVSGWTDIVDIIAENRCTVGLKSDGRVVATGNNDYGQCNVSGWTDIVKIICGPSSGYDCTIGLKSDGSVVVTADGDYGEYDVSDWTDIVEIIIGGGHTVGLKSDGRVVATGSNEDGECNVSCWKLFQSLDTLEQEQQEQKEIRERQRKEELEKVQAQMREIAEREAAYKARKAAEKARKKAELEQNKKALETELANLTGLFSGKRRKELETMIEEIEYELYCLDRN